VPDLAGAGLDDPGAAVSSTSRMPLISTFSTSGLTSPVSTMLLPPPSTNLGAPPVGMARSAAISASSVTRARRCARATMPKLLYGCSGTLAPRSWENCRIQHRDIRRESMPSFDTVCEPNMPEVKNAVENTAKEIATRFDFKGTAAAVDLKDKEITMIGRRRVPARAGGRHPARQAHQAQRRRALPRQGRRPEDGRRQGQAGHQGQERHRERAGQEDHRIVKDSKLKVQAAIQGDAVRITGAKRDDLQAAMALIKKDVPDMPLSFNNFRD
jgi:uncharacterized protein YajQ (UPF0234 family)